MLYGLDALAHGALAALVTAPVVTWLAWRVGAGAAPLRRLWLALFAGYGATALATLAGSLLLERRGFKDEAVLGALLLGLLLQAIACPILFLASRKA